MGRGGSVQCRMLGILSIAEPCKADGGNDFITRPFDFIARSNSALMHDL